MNISNISTKASLLISGLLVSVLLLWQFELAKKPLVTKPTSHSQSIPPSQVKEKSLAMAIITFPPPPPPATTKIRPSRESKMMPVGKKKILAVKFQKSSLKKKVIPAVKETVLNSIEAPSLRVLISDTSPETKEGRTLLRLLEHGSGPSIRLDWPEGSAARSSLYKLLRECYGMKTALMDPNGALYSSGERSQWRPDMDLYSGFVREPTGVLPFNENKEAAAIRIQHHLRLDSKVVRLFPRRVDAVLLGGLQNLLSGRYQNTKIIHAAYRQEGQSISISKITADGIVVRGRIVFSAALAMCRH